MHVVYHITRYTAAPRRQGREEKGQEGEEGEEGEEGGQARQDCRLRQQPP